MDFIDPKELKPKAARQMVLDLQLLVLMGLLGLPRFKEQEVELVTLIHGPTLPIA